MFTLINFSHSHNHLLPAALSVPESWFPTRVGSSLSHLGLPIKCYIISLNAEYHVTHISPFFTGQTLRFFTYSSRDGSLLNTFQCLPCRLGKPW